MKVIFIVSLLATPDGFHCQAIAIQSVGEIKADKGS